MSDKELTGILSSCLDQIAAGKTVAACLAQYPERAAELAPLLAMAAEVGSLRDHSLSEAARQRARARLLRAEIGRNRHGATRSWWLGTFAVSRLAAGLALVFVCVALTTGVVAASQPGDLTYPVRTLAERAPALLKTTVEARAMAELRIADRRLADLERYLATKGEVAPAAIDALLAGDRAVAGRADELSQVERMQAASRVAAHAAALTTLARSAQRPTAEVVLQAAATEAASLAHRLERGSETEGTPPTIEDRPTESLSVPATGVPTATATPTPEQTATATVQFPASTPVPGRRATALAQTATPPAAVATVTPEPSPIHTSTGAPDTPVPGRRATALAQTATPPAAVATVTPEPSPVHTSTGGPDTPVPGRRATALAQTATPPAAVATVTPEPSPVHTSTGGPDTPVPGRRATALAQTATPPAAVATVTPEPSPVHTSTGAPDTPVPGRRATALAQTATPPAADTSAPGAMEAPPTP